MLRVVACVLVVVFLAAPAAAQDTGTVSGTVVDSSGQVVPGAAVTLTNEATADARSATSSETGAFLFRAVPPGSYSVRVALQGFRTFEQKKTVVNASSQIDVGRGKLGVGTLAVVVYVVDRGATLEPKKNGYSGLLTSTQIYHIHSRGRDV